MIAIKDEIICFQPRNEGPWYPTLRVLHKYPSLMPKFRVDRGAIKFVLRGAKIKCPGVTSDGGRMEDVECDTPVQIVAEGCENACAVGISCMSTAEILKVNQGDAVDSLHHLNDGLWQFPTLS